MEIKDRIIQLRKVNRLTQSDLAKKLHVSDKLVSKWETGEGHPGINDIIDLGKIFGVSVDYLVTGTLRANDSKSINKEPTIDQHKDDFLVYLKKLLKDNKLLNWYDRLKNNITNIEVVRWVRNEKVFPYEIIVNYDDYKLYKLLSDNNLIIDTGSPFKNSFKDNINSFRCGYLAKNNIKDLGFYTEMEYEERHLNDMIMSFVTGKRIWDDKVILALIEKGGFITRVSSYNAYYERLEYEKDVFQTKLLKKFCEGNLKK